jgi:hypothetical protein
MGTALMHAESSAKRFGGTPNDYLEIHKFLDSSGSAFGDKRHRAVTHNSWFIHSVLPRVFGDSIVNSDGKSVYVIAIAKEHILEDFAGKFIPTLDDWLSNLEWQKWMDNGAEWPPNQKKTQEKVEIDYDKIKEFFQEIKNDPPPYVLPQRPYFERNQVLD